MARHRDIRNMDYTDEYEGYDDVYGHSVDDDYYISPSNRQFIYNRETSRDSAKFEQTEDNIKEADEAEELSDVDKTKLESCIDLVKTTLCSTNISRNELINLILKYKFNTELVLNAILEDPKYHGNKSEGLEKDVAMQKLPKFVIPNIFSQPQCNGILGSSTLDNNSKNQINFNLSPGSKESNTRFSIPQLSFSNSNTNNFVIPDIFSQKSDDKQKKFNIPNMINTSESEDRVTEFVTLSDFVSSHLKSSLPVNNLRVDKLSEQLTNVDISEGSKNEVKPSVIMDDEVENGNIDLSKALTSSISLTSISKNPDIRNDFEIPFIDCEALPQRAVVKTKILPCLLNISNVLNVTDNLSKRRSKFAKVLCRNYKLLNRVKVCHNVCPFSVKRFTFDTISPDDLIKSYLK